MEYTKIKVDDKPVADVKKIEIKVKEVKKKSKELEQPLTRIREIKRTIKAKTKVDTKKGIQTIAKPSSKNKPPSPLAGGPVSTIQEIQSVFSVLSSSKTKIRTPETKQIDKGVKKSVESKKPEISVKKPKIVAATLKAKDKVKVEDKIKVKVEDKVKIEDKVKVEDKDKVKVEDKDKEKDQLKDRDKPPTEEKTKNEDRESGSLLSVPNQLQLKAPDVQTKEIAKLPETKLDSTKTDAETTGSLLSVTKVVVDSKPTVPSLKVVKVIPKLAKQAKRLPTVKKIKPGKLKVKQTNFKVKSYIDDDDNDFVGSTLSLYSSFDKSVGSRTRSDESVRSLPSKRNLPKTSDKSRKLDKSDTTKKSLKATIKTIGKDTIKRTVKDSAMSTIKDDHFSTDFRENA